jgi:hypothetical protein
MNDGDLPPHAAGLTLEHDPHLTVYLTVAQWLAEFREGEPDFSDADARQRAIDTNSVWVLQWYPRTPVGFNWIAAPTLAEVLAFARRMVT